MGGAGFLGSHLCEALLGRGDEVVWEKKHNPSLERSPGIRIRGREARNKAQSGAPAVNHP